MDHRRKPKHGLRSLFAAFFVVCTLLSSSSAMADFSYCPAAVKALSDCNASNQAAHGSDRYEGLHCDQTSYAPDDSRVVVVTTMYWRYIPYGGTWMSDSSEYERSSCGNAPPPDLCASSAPFNGWMDFTGSSPGASCKEGCAYSFGDGESGAKVDGGNEQRFVGTFVPLGRKCTAAESAVSGTPAIGDPPPDPSKDPPKDPGTGTGNGNTPGNGTGNGGTGSGSGTGSGQGGGTGTGNGSGTGGGSGSGTGNGSGTGGSGDGSNGGGNGSGTGGNSGGSGGTGGSSGGGGGTGTGNGNGTGGNGTGGGGGNGTGNGNGGSNSGGTGGQGGGGNCTGSACNPASGSTSPTPSKGDDSKDKGTYAGDGCDAPPTCTGDAVMCGVAIESHKNRCAIENAVKGTSAIPDGVGKHDVSEITTPGIVDSGAIDKLDQSGLGFSQSCPFKSGEIAKIGEQAITQDMSPICDNGPDMRLFLRILTAISVAYIVGGFTRGGGVF